MTELKRIGDQLKRAYAGNAWHGPSLLEALTGVTAEQALAKPIPNSHSIWEIVLHIAAWEDAIRERLEKGPVAIPADGDFPDITEPNETGWKNTLALLEQRHQALLKVIADFPEARLNEKLGTEHDPPTASGYSAYYNLHGVIQHNLYHVGQIVLLKKFVA